MPYGDTLAYALYAVLFGHTIACIFSHDFLRYSVERYSALSLTAILHSYGTLLAIVSTSTFLITAFSVFRRGKRKASARFDKYRIAASASLSLSFLVFIEFQSTQRVARYGYVSIATGSFLAVIFLVLLMPFSLYRFLPRLKAAYDRKAEQELVDLIFREKGRRIARVTILLFVFFYFIILAFQLLNKEFASVFEATIFGVQVIFSDSFYMRLLGLSYLCLGLVVLTFLALVPAVILELLLPGYAEYFIKKDRLVIKTRAWKWEIRFKEIAEFSPFNGGLLKLFRILHIPFGCNREGVLITKETGLVRRFVVYPSDINNFIRAARQQLMESV